MTLASRLLLGLLLASSSFAAPLSLGGIQAVSPLEFGLAVSAQGAQQVAFGDKVYLAVWIDYRSGHASEVYGARISPSGQVLDVNGMNLSGYPAREDDPFEEPSVTWTGHEFVVAWRTVGDVLAVRVNEDGGLVDKQPIVVDHRTLAGSPHLASNGDSVLVATGRCIADPRAWTMKPDGTRIAEIDLAIPNPSGCAVAAASDGRNYLVAANGGGALQWRLTNDRNVVASGSLGKQASDVSAIWTGTEFLLFSATPEVTVWRISRGGEVLGTPQTISAGPASQLSSTVASGKAVVAWNETPALSLPTIAFLATIDGDALSTPRQLGFLAAPTLASDGASVMGIWTIPGSNELGHSLIDPEGDLPTVILTTRSAHEQRMVSAARSAASTAIVWQERIGEVISMSLEIRRDDGSTAIHAPLFPGDATQYSPVIAGNGETFAVAWFESSDAGFALRAALVDLDGTPVAGPITVDTDAEIAYLQPWSTLIPPALAWNGRTWIVVWSDDNGARLARAGISSEGTLLDAGGATILAASRGLLLWPSLVPGDHESLLVYQDGVEAYTCQITCPTMWLGQIRALRLDDDGRPIDPAPITISPGDDYAIRPTAAWNGKEFLAVWVGEGEASAHARRIDPSGALLGNAIPVFGGGEGSPIADRLAAAAMGERFLVAVATAGPQSDVYLVPLDGSVPGEPVPITSGIERESWPRVLAVSPTKASVFFEGSGARETPTASVARLYFRNVYADGIRRRALAR